MAYESQMQADILALLQLFRDRVPDKETHKWVAELVVERDRWRSGHEIFDRIRDRNLEAIDALDSARECQYCFEESCLQSLYNETGPSDPFDSCSPYWVIKNALVLARFVGVPVAGSTTTKQERTLIFPHGRMHRACPAT
ncbi:hypothetical protein CCP4SC76_1320001 [Gammaproteobacteria bacterium]